MTLIAHSTQADVTTFIGSKQLLQTLCSAAGGLFTGRKTWDAVVPCKKVLDGAGNSQFYHLRVRVRDTMNFSAGGTPLAALGDAVGLRKLEMSEDDYRHMDRVRDDETQRFIDYAIRDAEICHRYMAVAFGLLNIRYKPTIPSLSATYLRSCCEMVLSAMGYEGVGEGSCRTSAYDYHFRGLRRENKGLVPLNESQNFVMDSRLEPATEYARDCQDLARRAFKGGWNGCNVAGYFDLVTYDPDLCGAYPTASGAMLDPDYQQPFVATWEDRDMMLQQLPPWSAFRPGFGCVHFEFPDEVKYPCLGYQTDHGIVFPQTSEGTSGCYVTLPEVVLALRLGARVHAIRFVIPAVHQRDGILLAAYKGLIEQREHDAALYGKKSVQALGDKLMNNAGYGKHGQDVSPKEVRSLATLKMEDRGTSEITNAVVASMSTALPRICLLAAANQLAGLGYNVYSVTTDGFIMDAPFDVLTSLDLYGFADRMRYVRSYYTDGRSDAVWEIKHEQKRLLNQTTRLNIGFAPGGVLARGGYKGYKPEPGEHDVSAEAREQFAHDIVTRKGPLGYISRDWVSPVEMLQKDIDMRVCDGRHAANPNFDMKRMPDLDTMRDVEFECAGDIVRVATYDTRPYRTLADFRRHKTTVGGHQLVVREDYVAAATRAANYTGRDLADTDYVRWAVVAHRSGRITIPTLNELSGQERLDFINRFIRDGRKFGTNDWKNAGRQSRQNLPDEAVWRPKAEEMASACAQEVRPQEARHEPVNRVLPRPTAGAPGRKHIKEGRRKWKRQTTRPRSPATSGTGPTGASSSTATCPRATSALPRNRSRPNTSATCSGPTGSTTTPTISTVPTISTTPTISTIPTVSATRSPASGTCPRASARTAPVVRPRRPAAPPLSGGGGARCRDTVKGGHRYGEEDRRGAHQALREEALGGAQAQGGGRAPRGGVMWQHLLEQIYERIRPASLNSTGLM